MQKRRGFTLQSVPFSEISRDSLVGRFDGIIINLGTEHTRSLLAMLKGTGIPAPETEEEARRREGGGREKNHD